MIAGRTEPRKAAQEVSFAVQSRGNGRFAQDDIKVGEWVSGVTDQI